MKRKLFIYVLVVSVLFSSSIYINEVEAAGENSNTSSYEKLLVEHGYSKEMVENMDSSVKKIVGVALQDNPASVNSQRVCMQIDAFDEMEEILNIEEEDISEEDLDYYKEYVETIEELSQKSDTQLIKENNMSKAQTKIFREITESNEAINNTPREEKKIEEEVKASGSISSSKMELEQSVVNQSKNKKPKYTVCIVFNWKSPFEIGCYNDKVCCAWGGNLATGANVATAKYYAWGGIVFDRYWGKYKRSKNLKFEETSINKALVYSIPQSDNKGGKAKTGAMIFYLYQNKKNKGRATKVISQYCHKVISLKSDSISVSKSGVSFSIGGAYDKSAQMRSSITY